MIFLGGASGFHYGQVVLQIHLSVGQVDFLTKFDPCIPNVFEADNIIQKPSPNVISPSAGLMSVEAPGQQCYRKVANVMSIST